MTKATKTEGCDKCGERYYHANDCPALGYPKKKQTRKSKYLTADQRGKLWPKLSKECREATPYCEICGRRDGKLNAHHIIGRNQSALLYLAKCNVMVACFTCHTKLHNQPFWAAEVYSEKYGYEYCELLNKLQRLTKVQRTYDEAVDQMGWSVEDYEARYL